MWMEERVGMIGMELSIRRICANCAGHSLTPFPTSPGVWSPRNGTGGDGCNLAAIKIAFNFAGVCADPRSVINGHYDSSGCVPLTVLFIDTLHNAKKYIWSFGDGTPDTAITGFQVWHTYITVWNVSGFGWWQLIQTVVMWQIPAYLNIRVRTDRAILDFDITKLPPCELLNYHVHKHINPTCCQTVSCRRLHLGFW